MPETPDFEKLARQFSPDGAGLTEADKAREAKLTPLVADLLRQVWNARGAADLAQLQRPVSEVEAAIRALDR
jgi:hypothetical protein